MASEKKPNFFKRVFGAIAKFFRDYGSEMKKVTWAPADVVRKNTILVLIIVVLFAVGIGVLDFAFSNGVTALGELI